MPPAPVAPTPQSPVRAANDAPSASPAASRRYKIVEFEPQVPKAPARRYPTAPSVVFSPSPNHRLSYEHRPIVYSSKELEARKNARDFKMYDAVPSSAPTPMAVDEPSDMDNFLPMLNDYLSSAPRFPLVVKCALTVF